MTSPKPSSRITCADLKTLPLVASELSLVKKWWRSNKDEWKDKKKIIANWPKRAAWPKGEGKKPSHEKQKKEMDKMDFETIRRLGECLAYAVMKDDTEGAEAVSYAWLSVFRVHDSRDFVNRLSTSLRKQGRMDLFAPAISFLRDACKESWEIRREVFLLKTQTHSHQVPEKIHDFKEMPSVDFSLMSTPRRMSEFGKVMSIPRDVWRDLMEGYVDKIDSMRSAPFRLDEKNDNPSKLCTLNEIRVLSDVFASMEEARPWGALFHARITQYLRSGEWEEIAESEKAWPADFDFLLDNISHESASAYLRFLARPFISSSVSTSEAARQECEAIERVMERLVDFLPKSWSFERLLTSGSYWERKIMKTSPTAESSSPAGIALIFDKDAPKSFQSKALTKWKKSWSGPKAPLYETSHETLSELLRLWRKRGRDDTLSPRATRILQSFLSPLPPSVLKEPCGRRLKSLLDKNLLEETRGSANQATKNAAAKPASGEKVSKRSGLPRI